MLVSCRSRAWNTQGLYISLLARKDIKPVGNAHPLWLFLYAHPVAHRDLSSDEKKALNLKKYSHFSWKETENESFIPKSLNLNGLSESILNRLKIIHAQTQWLSANVWGLLLLNSWISLLDLLGGVKISLFHPGFRVLLPDAGINLAHL